MSSPIIIYCFPGQGSDHRLFESLTVPPGYEIKVIEYGTPGKGMNMHDFALRLSERIDTTRSFVLVGVSLGGMICSELNEILRPEKTIIISSAKNCNELSLRYRFQKNIPLYKLFPGSILLGGAKLLQPIVEPDRKHNKETFKSMLASKDPVYMERTIDMLINWNRTENTRMIYHIHGTRDHTLPIAWIKSPTHVVKNGSHLMTLTRAHEVSEILNSILGQDAYSRF
jgi:hypothetical protein